jgi:hypothetical protein
MAEGQSVGKVGLTQGRRKGRTFTHLTTVTRRSGTIANAPMAPGAPAAVS